MSGDRNDRLEKIALAATLVLVAAFLTSAIIGVIHRPAEPVAVQETGKTLPSEPKPARGRVEVLNAAGRSGLARAAADQLRDAGFDVVFFGNNRTQRDSSVVIDRIGRPDIAAAAGAALEITAVSTQKDTTMLLDASVIVGRDWTKRQAAKQAEVEKGWKGKVKRWLGR